MTKYELIYFDAAGRAEHIRICLAKAGVDWTDTRIKDFKEWPAIKPTTPLGSVPVLKIDGVSHCQSIALGRFAGKLAGWYPTDPLEALVVDEALDSLGEMMSKCPRAKDQDEMKKLREEYQEGDFKKYAEFLEGLIQKNGGTKFAKTDSIADLSLSFMVSSIESGDWTFFNPKIFESYPGIMATAKSMKENPDVVAYQKSKEESK